MSITIESSHGTWVVNADGTVVEPVESYEDLIRFDLDEWRRTYPGEELVAIDVLDIGYWYRKEDGSEGYEPAEPNWRARIARSKDRYLQCAIRWAADRWHLTEEDQVTEWVERSRADHTDPTELVDAYAHNYDLHEYCHPFGTRMPNRKEYQP